MAVKKLGSEPRTKLKLKAKPETTPKSRSKAKPRALSPTQQLLLDRLAAALPVLDEECLEALVQSAENLAESCRQDRMLDEARMLALEGGGVSERVDTGLVALRTGRPAPLTIKASSDGQFFHIVVDGKWKMLNHDELKSLVTVVGSKEPTEAVPTRLFNWLKRERADVLSDLGISTSLSPVLAELIAYLKKNFKIKK